MKLSEAKIGMVVRISNNLEITKNEYGLAPGMLKLRGTLCKIDYIDSVSICIYNNRGDNSFWFCPEDLKIPILKTKTKPVMFDPKNIIEVNL